MYGCLGKTACVQFTLPSEKKKKRERERESTNALYEFIELLEIVVQKCYRIKALYNVLYFSARIIKMDIFNL